MFTFPISKWVGGIRYEHAHRLIASAVGFLTVVARRLARAAASRARWVRRLGYGALARRRRAGRPRRADGPLPASDRRSPSRTRVSRRRSSASSVTIAVVTSPRWAEPRRATCGRPSRATRSRACSGATAGVDLPAAPDRRGHAPHEGRPRDPGLSARRSGGSCRRSTSFAVGIHFAHRVVGARRRRRSSPLARPRAFRSRRAGLRASAPSGCARSSPSRSRSARRRCSRGGRSASRRPTWPRALCCCRHARPRALARSPPRAGEQRRADSRRASPRGRSGWK